MMRDQHQKLTQPYYGHGSLDASKNEKNRMPKPLFSQHSLPTSRPFGKAVVLRWRHDMILWNCVVKSKCHACQLKRYDYTQSHGSPVLKQKTDPWFHVDILFLGDKISPQLEVAQIKSRY